MPYFYLTSEAPWSAAADALTGYLDRAGINLRRELPKGTMRQDAVRLVLHGRPRKSPGAAVYYTPMGDSVRFSYCLRRALGELPLFRGRVGSCAGAIGGRLMPTGVPTVLLVIGASERIAADPLARAIAQAATVHFRLPPVEPGPEEPMVLPQTVELLQYPTSVSPAYHMIPAGECFSVLGTCGIYLLARHRETVGFLVQPTGAP